MKTGIKIECSCAVPCCLAHWKVKQQFFFKIATPWTGPTPLEGQPEKHSRSTSKKYLVCLVPLFDKNYDQIKITMLSKK